MDLRNPTAMAAPVPARSAALATAARRMASPHADRRAWASTVEVWVEDSMAAAVAFTVVVVVATAAAVIANRHSSRKYNTFDTEKRSWTDVKRFSKEYWEERSWGSLRW